MTSPTNRTDEVAREIISFFSQTMPAYDRWGHLERAIASAITSAVEAERERCAVVVENGVVLDIDKWMTTKKELVSTVCTELASTIRQTPTKVGV